MRAAPLDITTQKKYGPIEYAATRTWRHGRALTTRSVSLTVGQRYVILSLSWGRPMTVRLHQK